MAMTMSEWSRKIAMKLGIVLEIPRRSEYSMRV